MSIYFTVFIVISILNLFSWRIKALRPTILLISFIILAFVSGLRDVTVGIDTKNYLGYFNSIINNGPNLENVNLSTLFIPSGFELGFTIYTYLVSLFTKSFAVYLFITSVLIYTPVYLFIKKYSSDYYLSFVIYYCLFFFGSMTLLRQSIAMSILLLGTKYIVNRNRIKFVLIVLLAASFHVSALIGLLLYAVYNKSLSKFTVLVTTAIASFVFVAMSVLVKYAAVINYRYEFYLDRIDSFSLASYLAFCLYLFILILLLLLQSKKNKLANTPIKQNFLVITSFASLIVIGLSIRVNSLDRLSLVYLIYTIISIPLFISSSKNSIRPAYIKLFLVCMFLAYATVILLIRPEWFGVTNYLTNTELVGK